MDPHELVTLPPVLLPSTEEVAAQDAQRRVARFFGAPPECVLVGAGLLGRVASTCLGAGDHALVAGPSHAAVLDAITASGARYVDAGRDHRFRVDPGGWRFGLSDPRVRLAYVASPHEPTGTTAQPGLLVEAAAANVLVLLDQRSSATPLRAVGARSGRVLVLRSLAAASGAPLPGLLFGPPELLTPLRRPEPVPAVLIDALERADALEARMARWRRRVSGFRRAARRAGLVCPGAGAPDALGVWVRVPGVPSAAIAARAARPEVVGDSSWTWRDAVRVTPPPPSQREAVLQALSGRLPGP